MPWFEVASIGDVEEGEAIVVQVVGEPVALFKVGGDFYAVHDRCTHGRASLAEGFVDDGCVECPLHEGRFDIRTGAALSGPVRQAVRSYPVKVEDERVSIEA